MTLAQRLMFLAITLKRSALEDSTLRAFAEFEAECWQQFVDDEIDMEDWLWANNFPVCEVCDQLGVKHLKDIFTK